MKIFLSGSMTGLSFEQAMKWRNEFKNCMYRMCDLKGKKCPEMFCPPEHFMPTDDINEEKYAMEVELHHLRNSDIIVANLNDNPWSIGTAMEIMLARELNIPVLLICDDKDSIHPWVGLSSSVIFHNPQNAVHEIVTKFITK